MTVLMTNADTAPATSPDFTVPANTPFVLSIFTAPGVVPGPSDGIFVDIKNDNGNYMLVGTLTKGLWAATLPPTGTPATYRLRRPLSSVPMGVDGR